MQLVFADGGKEEELDVRVENPEATVDDLRAVLAPHSSGAAGLLVDGRFVDGELRLVEAGLAEGAVLQLAARAPGLTARPPRPVERPLAEVAVVGGLGAGERFAVTGDHELAVGRDHECDIVIPSETVSHRHAALRVGRDGRAHVRDLGSHNGTWVDGDPVTRTVAVEPGRPIRIGAVELEARVPVTDDRPAGADRLRQSTLAGTTPFNRPPRAAGPLTPAPVLAPQPLATPGSRPPLNLIAAIAPLALGVVMVLVLKNLLFGLFALLSPVIIIGNWIEGRRRVKRSGKADRARFEREVAAFRTGLRQAVEAEVARRRRVLPDMAEVVRRAELPSQRLWERRVGAADFLLLRVGTGPVPWEPPVEGRHDGRDHALAAAVEDASTLPEAPIAVELADGGVVGIVGERGPAVALARALVCQAAVHHGPADLAVAVLCAPDRRDDWDWAKWLPHARDAGGGARLLSCDGDTSEALLQALVEEGRRQADRRGALTRASEERGRVLLAVLDAEMLTQGRQSPGRDVLRGRAGPAAGIVLAATADQLPAMCTTVVELQGPDGAAVVHRPQLGERIEEVLANGISVATARRCGRALAHFDDPELEVPGAGLPDRCRLLPLLEVAKVDGAALRARWRAAAPAFDPVGPIGVGEDGVFAVDLVRDGPHGLIGGTTGSGKSELLRTLVAGLAAGCDPAHLNFVLIDYKGGSAFDQCAALPHTVGVVTDLDEHLGERALRCLEAELRHRERQLREAGAPDLPAYLLDATRPPLPRLVVVIDEFATLAAELPDFIDALVGIAQRGRSLGVHLILATQRPQGAVKENIRANTNLRIALRVQDAADSTDVIGVADAAAIPRSRAGRAFVRLGPGEVIPIQTALATAPAGGAAADPVTVTPFRFGPTVGAADRVAAADDGPTDLALLVRAVRDASAGMAAPRRPWPEPLPEEVPLAELGGGAHGPTRDLAGEPGGGIVPIALADDPDAQDQYPVGWRPSDGNLLVYGIVGSGTTTALASVALSLAATTSPDDVHLYALDFGGGRLGALEHLPHTAAVIGAADRERQVRLVQRLRRELDRRRSLPGGDRAGEPLVVVLVDGFAAFSSEFDDLAGLDLMADFGRVFADGPELGISVVLTAERPGAIPSTLASQARQKVLLRLADRHDYGGFGVASSAVPDLPAGRGVIAGTGQLVQLGWPGDLDQTVAATAGRWPVPARPPEPVTVLPSDVPVAAVAAGASVGAAVEPWVLPIGIASSDLRPAALVLYGGEHALVAGPARSGKTTALAALAAVGKQADPGLVVVAVAGPRSTLASSEHVDRVVEPGGLAAALDDADGGGPGRLVLVDDAEVVDDVGGVLAGIISSRQTGVHVVAAGRAEPLRGLYSHWTRELRRSKAGLLLQPAEADADLLGVTLPRRPQVALTQGRGYLVHGGEIALVQVAHP